MHKKRLLILTNRFVPGGPLFYISSLARALQDDYEILVAGGPSGKGEELATEELSFLEHKPYIIHSMVRQMNPWYDGQTYRSIDALIRRFRPHIIHTHTSKPGTFGRLVGARQQVPVIVHTFHGHLFKGYFNPFVSSLMVGFERYLARKSSAIIAISERQYQALVQEYHLAAAEKVKLIPIAIDTGRITADKASGVLFRQRFHLPEQAFLLGMVGRLAPIKNIRLFIDGLVYLKSLKLDKEFRGLIVGDGPEREALHRYAQSRGLIPRSDLIFTGWCNKLPELYSALDAVVLTSLNEGAPFSLMEAAAAGLPVVASDVGGVADIVRHEQTGYLFDPREREDFYAMLVKLITREEQSRVMGQKAKVMAQELFSTERMVEAHNELYQSLLSLSRHS